MTQLVSAPAKANPGLMAPGHGGLKVEMVEGQSAVTSAWASSPLKLLVPQPRGQSAWVYSSSFGGGFVAGDEVCVSLEINDGARCFLSTQASTKVYHNPAGKPCSYRLDANVGPNGLLVLAPDPVQAFAGSAYSQQQNFNLAPDANLVLVDWYCSGRAARGERWAFTRLQSRNQISVGGQRRLVDALRLDPADGAFGSPHRMGRFNCFAVVVLLGGMLHEASAQLLAEVGAEPVPRRGALISCASPLTDGAIARFAGESVEAVGAEIRRHLAFLPGLLGDDPLRRKW